ncbi:MAG: TonB-dependent receptor, partial [Alphaproteobacteria bacterium]
MKTASKFYFLPLAALFAAGAMAQQPTSTPEVVVTATRLPTDIEQVGSSVTIITAADIERRQQRTIVDVLRAVPGLRVVQLGPVGQQTSVFARGANSNQTLVLIDGLEAGDPSAPNGAFNFAHLVPENIERIEIVRGPQSTLYGSDAIGSVINIITKRGEGAPSFSARMEGGGHATFNPSVSASGKVGRVGFSATTSFYKTDGESITAARVRPAGVGAEEDGYENFTASARLDADVTDRIESSLIGRFLRADSDTDPTAEDPNARIIERQYFLRWQTGGRFFDDRWEPRIAFNLTRYRRFPSNDPDGLSVTVRRAENTGEKLKAELQNDVHISEDTTLTLGGEAETEALRQTTNTDFGGFIITGNSDVNVDNHALFIQDRFTLFKRLSGTLGLRRDEHQTFGGKTTGRATLVYRHAETGSRVKASYGTGF